MSIPLIATYRVQLNREFTFASLREALPYINRLGVSHVYCSPVLAARPGSTHGYDVIDPTRINPEIGTEDEWRALSGEVHALGMGLVLDIVPNHMAASEHNPYWDDVLARGEASEWARWFDVDWVTGGGRVVLPVLADNLDEVLARGEMRVAEVDGRRRVLYLDMSFPVADGSPHDLQELLIAQRYRLVHWKRASQELNYRRFFDVNELVALRAEDEEVFDQTHGKILEWVRDGIVDGLRVDHVDGLRDPQGYLERLRAQTGEGCRIWVEKILLGDEPLRASWPVQGTTGYESIQAIEDALIDAEGVKRIESGYRLIRSAPDDFDFERAVREGKEMVLRSALRPDMERLTHLLHETLRTSSPDRPPGRRALSGALGAVISCLRVYRTYVRPDGSRDVLDDALLSEAVRQVRTLGLARERELAQIQRTLGSSSELALRFVLALQQLSGPASAKGVEDTALYRWVPLASRNEIGADPGRPLGDADERFHKHMIRYWPQSLRAASSHDTKRSADARARIHVLSELSSDWIHLARNWRERHAPLRQPVPGMNQRTTPDASAEYLLYQTLVALWPDDRIAERATEYMIKASREAKERTSWTSGDDSFETGLRHFINSLMQSGHCAAFRKELSDFVERIDGPARALSLAREAIRFTAPGVPDIYQGDELWNYSVVDPDNRRSVDYSRSLALLDAAMDGSAPQETKLYVIARLLQLRRRTDFEGCGYEELKVRGIAAGQTLAFLRNGPDADVITLVARRCVTHPAWGSTIVMLPGALAGSKWRCALSDRLVSSSNAIDELDTQGIRVADALATLPVCVLVRERT